MNFIMAFCLLLSVLSFSLNTLANNMDNSNSSSGTAETTLKELLPSNCFFSANFIQNRDIKKLPIPLSSSGKLLFSCDYGLLWKTEKPIQETLIYSTPHLNYRIAENNSIEVLAGQKHNYLSKFLLSILSNDIKKIGNEFTITKNVNNGMPSILLNPNNNFIKKGLESIRLSKTANQLPSNLNESIEEIFITITDTQNQSTRITINNFQTLSLETTKKNSKDISGSCNLFMNETISCNILEKPYSVEIINSNN